MDEGALEGGVLMTIHRLSQGGADRVAMLLANGFVAAGIPTGLVVLRSGGEGENALLDLLDSRVVLAHAGDPMGSRHLELVRGARYVRHQIARARPAIVLATSSNMGLVTGLAVDRKQANGPRLAMKLTNPVLRPCDRSIMRIHYRKRLYDFIFRQYDRILILTDEERRSLASLFPGLSSRFVTVANPYVAPNMTTDRARAPRCGEILVLARMMPQKRLDRVLDAFAKIPDKTTRLTILGEGPEREPLERQAKALGIGDRVAMPGFVDDVLPWLKRADLFALSSDYEGLPAAVLEALACDVPVVTTDCFEAARTLLDGAPRCAVVPRDDVDAFAAAMSASLTDASTPDLRGRAEPYRFGPAIAAHAEIMTSMLHAHA
jgi:glycosyltransferase involved in cell wall biosynthesis